MGESHGWTGTCGAARCMSRSLAMLRRSASKGDAAVILTREPVDLAKMVVVLGLPYIEIDWCVPTWLPVPSGVFADVVS